MKKTILISLLFFIANSTLLAQTKVKNSDKKVFKKTTPQYSPLYFGIDVMQQLSQSKVVGSAAISTVQKAYLNLGINGGYRLGKHAFELGFSLGNSNNGWTYFYAKQNVKVNPDLNRQTLNTRFGYDFTAFSLNNRVNLAVGAGVNWINVLNRDTIINYFPEALDKLISAQDEKLVANNSFGIDGKITLNFALSAHFNVRIFGQYLYAPTVLRAANAVYYDAISGLKQDAATINSAQNAFVFGIGLQYNLVPLFEQKKEAIKANF